MSAIKPVLRELREAGVKGGANLKDKLHQVADRLDNHMDDVIRRVKNNDRYDGPGSNGDRTPDSRTNPWQPSLSRKPSSMSDQDYLDILDSSVHNPNGGEAVLGKYYVPGTSSYVDVAEGQQPPATYFSLGDRWGDIRDSNNLTDPDMFDAFNVPFLERMMAEGKPITFSHNPLDFPDSALADELDFLRDHGYRFDPTTMQAVPR
ncbi:hypothetical protein [Marisediminicola sp. LYQ85]|uniref:hypothetical protein n=1 Tax=Marisediminicola sp. LYQ85 TaxID=3391062 RepID=UPI003982DA00